MKLINTVTKEVLGTITTNHRMSLDDAIELLEIEIQSEPDGDGYAYEELDLIND